MGSLGVISPLTVLVLGVFLAGYGLETLRYISIFDFFSSAWFPSEKQFGIFPLVVGTVTCTLLALMITVPLGLSSAIYLTLYAKRRSRAIADASIALLGAIPSVIMGLWGMTWIVPIFGNSLASASLVLALMVTPTFTLLAGAALRQVPRDLLETTKALGVSETVQIAVLIRHARWGIVGAAVLAASRGLGEAIAISMVAGNVAEWPSLLGPISTLTTILIIEFDASFGLHRNALYLLVFLVGVLIVGVSLVGRLMERRKEIYD